MLGNSVMASGETIQIISTDPSGNLTVGKNMTFLLHVVVKSIKQKMDCTQKIDCTLQL